METTEKLMMEEQEKRMEQVSLKHTLVSTTLFVGGVIVAFILLLIIVYMVRV